MNQSEKVKFLKNIQSYIRGELGQQEIDDLWKLFLTDRGAFRLFETELHFQSIIREERTAGDTIHASDLPEPDGNESGGFSSYRMWVLSAAAVIILAIGVQFFSIPGSQSPDALAVVDIDSSHLVGAELLRSDDEEGLPVNVKVNQAVAKAYEGDNEEAIRLLREAMDMEPAGELRVLTNLNLGILYYNTGDYSSSVEAFRSVVNAEGLPGHRYEKAWWFMGNAYLNLGELEQAREAVFNAYTLDGRFNRPALALLKKIDLRLEGDSALPAPQQIGR